MPRRIRALAGLIVINLAIGLGASIAIFSLADALLFRPLPYPAADELVTALNGYFPQGDYAGLRRRLHTLELGAYTGNAEMTLLQAGRPYALEASAVSANFFSVLGVAPALGTTFQAGQDQPGADGVVVLSDALWRERFAANPAVVGSEIALDGVERRVVGVMPASFRFPAAGTQLWVPVRLDPRNGQNYWSVYTLQWVGRLHRGVPLPEARAEMRAAAAATAGDFPYPIPADWGVIYPLVSLHEALFGNLRTTLLLLLGGVGLVLLVACANAANLLLTRFAGRRRETAIRLALGAGRARIVRGFVAEAVGYALAGGALGFGLAALALPVVLHWLPVETAALVKVGLDGRALGFAAAASLLAGLLTGLAPAGRVQAAHLTAGLGAAPPAAAHPLRTPLAFGLLVAETALAVVVAVAGILLARSLAALDHQDPGFRAAGVAAVRVDPGPGRCGDAARCVQFYDALLARAAALPGVQSAALVNEVPLGGDVPIAPVIFENHPLLPGQSVPLVWANAVSPGYLGTLDIGLRQGRGFSASDADGALRVALISATLAGQLWPGGSALGKQVLTLSTARPVAWTIVGVVADVREFAVAGDPGFYHGEMYFPLAQALPAPPVAGAPAGASLLLRSPAPPAAGRLHALIAGLDPEAPPAPLQPLAAIVSASLDRPRSVTGLFAAFALLALALAGFGVYAVTGQSVAQRGREFGVRMAIGARGGDLLAQVLREAMAVAAWGVAAGLGLAWGLSRLLHSLLFGVSATDPLAFALAAAVAAATAGLGAYGPARRATRTDPLIVLRGE